MSCTSVLFALPVPPMMPSVSPAFTRRLMSVSTFSFACAWYLKLTWSNSMSPRVRRSAGSPSVISAGSSSTSTIRPALASERVSSKKTLEIIMSEFMICMT